MNYDSSNIMKMLKGMTFDAFLDLLLSIYAVLLEGMNCISSYHELFSIILSETQSSGVEFSSEIHYGEDGSSQKDVEKDGREEKEEEIIEKEDKIDPSKESEKGKETNGEEKEIVKQQIESSSSNSSNSLSTSRFSTALKITTGIRSIIKKTSSLTAKVPPLLPSESLLKESETIPPSPSPSSLSPSSIPNQKPTKSKSDINSNFTQLSTDSSQIVFAAADLAHVKCANLLAVRADQNAQLNQKDFYRLFNVTWAFVLECESLCGRMCYGLRGTISSQVNYNYLQSSSLWIMKIDINLY